MIRGLLFFGSFLTILVASNPNKMSYGELNLKTQVCPLIKIVGVEIKTSNYAGQAFKDIPKFWASVMKKALLNKVSNRCSDDLYGIYTNFTSDPVYPSIEPTANALVNNLVDITTIIPDIFVDLKYASTDNFTKAVVYDSNICLVHKKASFQLNEVQKELKKMGLSLKIWDGYRSFSAQERFWQLLPDPRYVSDPRKGGRHTRGTAVDVTIVTKDGQELPMPSAFDEFSQKAHRNYMMASHQEIQNRELLNSLMQKHGFVGLPTEWWHFDLVGWENHSPIKGVSKQVYSSVDEKGTYSYIIGVPVYDFKDISGDFVTLEIPQGSYARFSVQKADPYNVGVTWQEIWKCCYESKEFDKNRSYECEYEHYAPSGEINIYIGLKK